MRQLALFLILLLCIGCEEAKQYQVRHMPERTPEAPVANIPRSLRVHNWRGNRGEGSCVHASTKNTLIWLNDFAGAAAWKHENGETANGLLGKLRAAGHEYLETQNGNYRYLEWASDLRLPAVIWWKPSHSCMFGGFSKGSSILEYYPRAVDTYGKPIDPAREYAAILDNNRIDAFEYTEKSQFIRLWHGYGGFAAILLKDPTTSIPYESYQLY
jgi:hypothetical protein